MNPHFKYLCPKCQQVNIVFFYYGYVGEHKKKCDINSCGSIHAVKIFDCFNFRVKEVIPVEENNQRP
jgi:hypothetical protein